MTGRALRPDGSEESRGTSLGSRVRSGPPRSSIDRSPPVALRCTRCGGSTEGARGSSSPRSAASLGLTLHEAFRKEGTIRSIASLSAVLFDRVHPCAAGSSAARAFPGEARGMEREPRGARGGGRRLDGESREEGAVVETRAGPRASTRTRNVVFDPTTLIRPKTFRFGSVWPVTVVKSAASPLSWSGSSRQPSASVTCRGPRFTSGGKGGWIQTRTLKVGGDRRIVVVAGTEEIQRLKHLRALPPGYHRTGGGSEGRTYARPAAQPERMKARGGGEPGMGWRDKPGMCYSRIAAGTPSRCLRMPSWRAAWILPRFGQRTACVVTRPSPSGPSQSFASGLCGSPLGARARLHRRDGNSRRSGKIQSCRHSFRQSAGAGDREEKSQRPRSASRRGTGRQKTARGLFGRSIGDLVPLDAAGALANPLEGACHRSLKSSVRTMVWSMVQAGRWARARRTTTPPCTAWPTTATTRGTFDTWPI